MNNLTNIRYGYFDALRAFAILLVVIHHVLYFSLGIDDGINVFIASFFMPLFFFISGFFAYKPLDTWNGPRILKVLAYKFKVLLIGTSVFLCLYLIFVKHILPDYHSFFAPLGFWFPYALFRLFVGYYAIVLISLVSRRKELVFWTFLIVSGVACLIVYLYYDNIIQYLRWSDFSEAILYQVIFKQAVCYFPYFAIGIIARAHLDKFEKILSSEVVKIIVIISVVSFWVLTKINYIYIPLRGGTMLFFVRCILTITLFIQVFYRYRHEFDKDTTFSKSIKLIGRRTLGIYFMHYFFLPDLQFLKPYFVMGNPDLMQWSVGLLISLIIIGICLLVGLIIRMSPTLAECLLGVRRKE